MTEPVLTTDRLKLYLTDNKELDDLYALRSDDEVMRWLGPKAQTKSDIKKFLAKHHAYHEKHGLGFLSVYDEHDKFIGQAGIFHVGYHDEQPEIELGYRFHKKAWGKGYATEAAMALIDWTFSNNITEVLRGYAAPGNDASKNVLSKCHFDYLGLVDSYYGEHHKFELSKVKWKDIKENAYKPYDDIAEWMDNARTKDLSLEQAMLYEVEARLSTGASILDIGCGAGEPIAKYFIEQGYSLTGIDASQSMLAMCKERFKQAAWIQADMRTYSSEQKFDLCIAWHSLFHIKPDEQATTITHLINMVKPGGLFVFTSGPDYAETWSNNGGRMLYHGSLSEADYRDILTENGCEVLMHKSQDPTSGGATYWITKKVQ